MAAEELFEGTPVEGLPSDHEVIDSQVLIAELRARRLSRNQIIDDLMTAGLTLDEATDVFDEDVPVRLARSGGEIRRLDRVPASEPLAGIGGWLLIAAFLLVFLIYALVHNLFAGFDLLGAADAQADAAAVLDRSSIVEAIAIFAVFLAMALVTALLFFRKHRWAPRCYIALIVVVHGTLTFRVATMESGPAVEAVPLLLLTAFSLFWIVYFLRSERVRNTFVK